MLDRIDGAILDVAAEILVVADRFVGWAKLDPQERGERAHALQMTIAQFPRGHGAKTRLCPPYETIPVPGPFGGARSGWWSG